MGICTSGTPSKLKSHKQRGPTTHQSIQTTRVPRFVSSFIFCCLPQKAPRSSCHRHTMKTCNVVFHVVIGTQVMRYSQFSRRPWKSLHEVIMYKQHKIFRPPPSDFYKNLTLLDSFSLFLPPYFFFNISLKTVCSFSVLFTSFV